MEKGSVEPSHRSWAPRNLPLSRGAYLLSTISFSNLNLKFRKPTRVSMPSQPIARRPQAGAGMKLVERANLRHCPAYLETLDSVNIYRGTKIMSARFRHVCCSISDKKPDFNVHRRLAMTSLSLTAVANKADAGTPCLCSSCGPLKRLFAYSMATTMDEYEMAIHPVKQMLFQQLYSHTVADADTVRILDVGCGTGPNLRYYIPDRTILTALDPNPYMETYFQQSLMSCPEWSGTDKSNVTWLEGAAESLPFENGSFDAVVCTLVLCSVRDVSLAVAEAKRVLRPGGKLLFIEHVAAENGWLQIGQLILDPLQQALNDGCHLRRNPLPHIQSAGGFTNMKSWAFQVEGMALIAPHVAGMVEKI